MTFDPEMVTAYIDALSTPRRDDAYHALLDLGVAALPFIDAAVRSETTPSVRATLIDIAWRTGSNRALPMLARCLQDDDASVWKAALDGLVTLADWRSLEVLLAAKVEAARDKLPRIDEAIEQIRARMQQGPRG